MTKSEKHIGNSIMLASARNLTRKWAICHERNDINSIVLSDIKF